MMRKVFAYFFFVLLTVQTFHQLIIVGNFLYNQDYIAANFCENIDQPELECNGKCHLKKELTEDTKKNQEDKIVVSENILFLSNEVIEIILGEPTYLSEKINYSHYLDKNIDGYLSSVFHPPC